MKYWNLCPLYSIDATCGENNSDFQLLAADFFWLLLSAVVSEIAGLVKIRRKAICPSPEEIAVSPGSLESLNKRKRHPAAWKEIPARRKRPTRVESKAETPSSVQKLSLNPICQGWYNRPVTRQLPQTG